MINIIKFYILIIYSLFWFNTVNYAFNLNIKDVTLKSYCVIRQLTKWVVCFDQVVVYVCVFSLKWVKQVYILHHHHW